MTCKRRENRRRIVAGDLQSRLNVFAKGARLAAINTMHVSKKEHVKQATFQFLGELDPEGELIKRDLSRILASPHTVQNMRRGVHDKR